MASGGGRILVKSERAVRARASSCHQHPFLDMPGTQPPPRGTRYRHLHHHSSSSPGMHIPALQINTSPAPSASSTAAIAAFSCQRRQTRQHDGEKQSSARDTPVHLL